MPRYFAFLRAISAGRGRTVKMETLRQLFESLGFSGVATYIASGNVIFETGATNTAALERRIEKRLQEALGYSVPVYLRTNEELIALVNDNPFPPFLGAGVEVGIIFLPARLSAAGARDLLALQSETDEFQIHGREIYWLRRRLPEGSRVPVLLDETLGMPFTIRTPRTIGQLAARYARPVQ